MKLTKQLAIRLNEVLLNGKWVTGTNLKDELSVINWKQAISKVEELNSIAALTFHIHYYIAGVLEVLEGGDLTIKDKFSFDAPPIYSEEDWKQRVAGFIKDSERFINLIEEMPDDQLFQPFVDEKYGNYLRNIDVIMEHTYYHFGQIVLLKKLQKI